MTTAARDVLEAFKALSPADQQQVATAIFRHSAAGGDLPETALDELAADLFHRYDVEEAARGEP